MDVQSQADSEATEIPAGWYKVQDRLKVFRWWTGDQWTEETIRSKDTDKLIPEQAGWYNDPKGSDALRWWDGIQWSSETKAKASEESHIPNEAGEANHPSSALDWEPTPSLSVFETNHPSLTWSWKPAPGFSVLGACVNFLLTGLVDIDVSAGIIFAVAFVVCSILYALIFYRSYFSEKPLLKSSKAISFFNFLFGWIVFGALWNKNLRRYHLTGEPKRGISYIVFSVFEILSVLAITVSLIVGLATYSENPYYVPGYSSNFSGMTTEQNDDVSRFVDEDAGVSFVMPEGWRQENLVKERQFIRWKAYPDSKTANVGITYGAAVDDSFDPQDASEDEICDFLEGSLAANLDGCSDETIRKVEINGMDYWELTGSGHFSSKEVSGLSGDVQATMMVHFEKGLMACFQFFELTGLPSEADYYGDFETLLESVQY